MISEKPYVLKRWYEYMDTHDFNILDELLAEEVVFHSPVVHTPQRGKKITKIYLMAADKVLGTGDFTYTKETVSVMIPTLSNCCNSDLRILIRMLLWTHLSFIFCQLSVASYQLPVLRKNWQLETGNCYYFLKFSNISIIFWCNFCIPCNGRTMTLNSVIWLSSL